MPWYESVELLIRTAGWQPETFASAIGRESELHLVGLTPTWIENRPTTSST
jgi:hypothetical protein